MFKKSKSLAISLLLTLGFCTALAIPAQAEIEPATILIVDKDALFTQSLVGKDARRQMDELAAGLRKEAEATQRSLAAEAQQIAAQKNELTQDELRAKIEALGLREREAQQVLGKKQTEMKLGGAVAQRKIQAVLEPIFAKVMQEHGANMMIDQNLILVGSRDYNVTEEIMGMLNDVLTELKVEAVDIDELRATQAAQTAE